MSTFHRPTRSPLSRVIPAVLLIAALLLAITAIGAFLTSRSDHPRTASGGGGEVDAGSSSRRSLALPFFSFR